jgi:hypothetical protein
LGEIFNGTSHALMTYSIAPGEVQHAPGTVTLGMFQDMGWMLSGGPNPTPTKTATPTPLPTCMPVVPVTPQPTPNGATPYYVPLIIYRPSDCAPPPTPTSTPDSNWVTIVSQDFEGSFPGVWTLADTSGGVYKWGKRNCQVFGGSSSGWAVGGGSSGQSLPCGSNYPLNVDTWMAYGSFSLVGATDAEILSKAWVNSEIDFDDVCFMASINNFNYYGTCYDGNSQGWISVNIDLTNVFTIGDLRGQPNVWIALIFRSDDSINYPHGAYVDDIVLRKCTGSCPSTNNLILENPSLVIKNAEMVIPQP